MFDLEKQISEWREELFSAGIGSLALDELEIHLREEIELQIKSGLGEQDAFETAIKKIGDKTMLKDEFKKNDAENWNRPLAWAAWISFTVSFFLPAFGDDGPGWKCAYLSAHGFVDSEFWHGNLGGRLIGGDFHLTLLTLANVLMVVSPFLLTRFSPRQNFMKYWCAAGVFAAILVWSYLTVLMTHADIKDLRIGCYLWAVSFLPLCLSTLKTFQLKKAAAAS